MRLRTEYKKNSIYYIQFHIDIHIDIHIVIHIHIHIHIHVDMQIKINMYITFMCFGKKGMLVSHLYHSVSSVSVPNIRICMHAPYPVGSIIKCMKNSM